MTIKPIHQFSPTVTAGDGVSNGVFYLQKILHQLGVVSHIYAEDIDDSLSREVLHYLKMPKNPKQILLIHYSIYYDFDKWLNDFPCQKIMIYHNITPYRFFDKGTKLYELCKKGRDYLPVLSDKVIGAIGDSELNTQELKSCGFLNTKTIPTLIDLNKIQSSPWNQQLFDALIKDFTIIFVGRIARNKAQHDLIEIANILSKTNNDFKLFIIGGTTDIGYEEELRNTIDELGLGTHVKLTGKVSNEDLYAYYRSANIFLCMSEHEGFGIPLIEAMLFNIPVIAYDSSNIKSTLNGGGILFEDKSYEYIAGTINLLKHNKPLRREVLNTQQKAISLYEHDNIVSQLITFLNRFDIHLQSPNAMSTKNTYYQFEGPFDSSYSLSIINQNAALAFEQKHTEDVALYSIDGYQEYIPNPKFLQQHPDVMSLYTKGKKAQQCEVVLRNLYPPNVYGMRGKFNIIHGYGWEESSFPRKYIDNFNLYLDGITVMSQYVKNTLVANGLKIPVEVVGLGVEHILKTPPTPIEHLQKKEGFKFLHVSSCFPRKGVDVLLEAFAREFTKSENVCLIIKTFPNPHNKIHDQLKAIRQKYPEVPEIIVIDKDLDVSQIRWLYKSSDALVCPSRGEGFGYPLAEAMLLKLPVITTGYGGQIDFCSNETAWCIDYTFAPAQTHFDLFDSYWVEPDTLHLSNIMREHFEEPLQKKLPKINAAYANISSYTWEQYRCKTEKFLKKLKDEPIFIQTQLQIAWISSFNTKCGIAAYSEAILERLDNGRFVTTKFANMTEMVLDAKKENGVVRCWNNRFDKNLESLSAHLVNYDVVVLNFNFGFFNVYHLGSLIKELWKQKIPTIVIFHSAQDVKLEGLEASLSWIQSDLEKASYLLVHSINDLNYFKKMGLNNAQLLFHGIKRFKIEQNHVPEASFTIATFGFLLPHKGILELIEAFALLCRDYRGLKLILLNARYPGPDSQLYEIKCRQRIQELNIVSQVKLVTDFLSDKDSFTQLQKADLLVMPYRNTNESSSAAVRVALSTLKPVLCTKQAIFNDVEQCVHFMGDQSPDGMSKAIQAFIENPNLLEEKKSIQKRWLFEHDWDYVAKIMENFILHAFKEYN